MFRANLRDVEMLNRWHISFATRMMTLGVCPRSVFNILCFHQKDGDGICILPASTEREFLFLPSPKKNHPAKLETLKLRASFVHRESTEKVSTTRWNKTFSPARSRELLCTSRSFSGGNLTSSPQRRNRTKTNRLPGSYFHADSRRLWPK